MAEQPTLNPPSSHIPRAPPKSAVISSSSSNVGGGAELVPQTSDHNAEGVVTTTQQQQLTGRRSQQMVSARTAPSNGNMFTRFMKTSIGADVGPPLPRSEGQQLHLVSNTLATLKSSSARLPDRTAAGNQHFLTTAATTAQSAFLGTGGSSTVGAFLSGPTATGVELNPLHRTKPDQRRQIGILCNNMTTLDMVELAHKIVPAVSLGSPRFEAQAPPKLGEERYDYNKHQRASTKVVERADAALGQRSNMSVVFYNTNPGALTSRRDFKLVTVPNHRDIQDSLEQQQLAKLATRCAHHVTAGFEPSSSSDDEESKKRRQNSRKYRRGLNLNNPAAAGAGGVAGVTSADSSEGKGKGLGTSSKADPSNSNNGNGGAAGDASAKKQLGTNAAQLQAQQPSGGVKFHASSCSCVHCVYVRDELNAFDRARNPATAKPSTGSSNGGNGRKQTLKKGAMPKASKAQHQQHSSDASSAQRQEQHRRFLGGAAFSGGGAAGTSATPNAGSTAAVLAGGGGGGGANGGAPPLLQRLLSFQAALKWIRGLDQQVHAAIRCSLIVKFPNLRNDFDTLVAARLRRLTVGELLLSVATTPFQGNPIVPKRRDIEVEMDATTGQVVQTPVTERSVGELLLSVATTPFQGNPIVPKRRDIEVEMDATTGQVVQTPVTERFTLPARAIYGVNHYQQKYQPAPPPQSGRTSVDTTTTSFNLGSAPTALQQSTTTNSLTQAEMLILQRPWEELFNVFDPNTTGACDRFHLLLALLAATSHHVLLEPESLKLDSRQYTHITCIVLLISGALLHERRPGDGPIRLGELFAIRDFLKAEILAAKALAFVDAEGWTYDVATGDLRQQDSLNGLTHNDLVDHPKLTSKKRLQLIKQFDTMLLRVDEFASTGTSMIEREDLLDAPQVASMLQEYLLLQ
ncbi:Hypothetical protein, putative [Bodo saltans]|uniref:Uncharacterized protein n=1 Tax=Bodo saltans TaxID=75058 RepID=A0A0S4INJ6_BODSA|nr:Hypothetical protein, putative [Bodo saltans]|eukprot:CUE75772.1 Hypothetical protein, putative [Bodo saltans]